MKMKVLLVDSDVGLRGALWNLLGLYGTFQLEAELETTEEVTAYVQSHDVDAVFINYQPADANLTSTGDYLAAILAQSHPHIQVVVYSESREAAYHACRSQCAGYLLAPFDPLALQLLVRRMNYIYSLQLAEREHVNRSILVKTRDGYQLARLNDILFIEHNNRKNRIVTETGQEIIPLGYSMNEIERMLEGSGFYRCYQSFIVNLSKISFIRVDNDNKNYAIQFSGHAGEILLSRDKYAEILSLLKGNYAKIHL